MLHGNEVMTLVRTGALLRRWLEKRKDFQEDTI